MKRWDKDGKDQRYCDKCGKTLTHVLKDQLGKFGNATRIDDGVVTIQWTKKVIDDKHRTVTQSGEWCKECAPAAMAVFMDGLLEKM